jgi:UDP:flavonoid glycosyltransferase YjiC (YdhE family)
MPIPPAPRLACFVTPHGFGHAARLGAILEALVDRFPRLEVELFTTVPEWFFEGVLGAPFGYHPLACDVGMAQRDSLVEDLPATVTALDAFLPFDPRRVRELAARVDGLGCAAVLCDIAPLGLAVAHGAGLPSVLVESFTWDWVYRSYLDLEPRLEEHARHLEPWFERTDLHLQTTPVCRRCPAATLVGPVSRRPRRPRRETREQLGAGEDDRLVLVTMGGIEWDFGELSAPPVPEGVTLVVPGGSRELRRVPGALLMPHRSPIYHPDLVAACDAVIGKLGYSTVAETWAAGLPLAFVPRRLFPESRVLAAFVAAEMEGLLVPEESFRDGSWVTALAPLLELPRRERRGPRGADEAAERIAGILRDAP